MSTLGKIISAVTLELRYKEHRHGSRSLCYTDRYKGVRVLVKVVVEKEVPYSIVEHA